MPGRGNAEHPRSPTRPDRAVSGRRRRRHASDVEHRALLGSFDQTYAVPEQLCLRRQREDRRHPRGRRAVTLERQRDHHVGAAVVERVVRRSSVANREPGRRGRARARAHLHSLDGGRRARRLRRRGRHLRRRKRRRRRRRGRRRCGAADVAAARRGLDRSRWRGGATEQATAPHTEQEPHGPSVRHRRARCHRRAQRYSRRGSAGAQSTRLRPLSFAR